jgi:hypothetical protein
MRRENCRANDERAYAPHSPGGLRLMGFKTSDNLGTHRSPWLVLWLVVLAFGLRVWGSNWGLPELYHPDENKIVNRALAFGKGDLNPHYFGWPSLQMYVMFFIYGCYFIVGSLWGVFASPEQFLVAFAVDPSNVYLLGRWFSAALGALTVWLTYSAGQRLYRSEVGLIGALFLTVNILHVKDSHYITPDVPVAFMVLAAFLLAVRTAENPQLKNYLLAAVVTGLAISVKYPAFLVAVPLLVAHLLAVTQKPSVVGVFSGRAWLAAAAIPIAFVIGTPYSVLDWQNFLIDLQHQQIQVSRPLPLLRRAVTLFFQTPFLALGAGIYVCAVAGMVRCLLRGDRRDLLLLCFPLSYLGFLLVTGGLQYRYLMPVLPFLCLLAAVFLIEVCNIRLAPLGTAAIAIALAVYPAWQSIELDLRLSGTDTRTQAKNWIEQNIPADARIALDPQGPRLLSRDEARQYVHRKPTTVAEWVQHRDRLTEHSVYTRLRDVRVGSDWRKYDSLMQQAKDRAQVAHRAYRVIELSSVPYVWRLRHELGQVTELDIKGHPGFKHFFEPALFLSENNIEYVVFNSPAASNRLQALLRRKGYLIHKVDTLQSQRWLPSLPFQSFHNPTVEIFRIKSEQVAGQ